MTFPENILVIVVNSSCNLTWPGQSRSSVLSFSYLAIKYGIAFKNLFWNSIQELMTCLNGKGFILQLDGLFISLICLESRLMQKWIILLVLVSNTLKNNINDVDSLPNILIICFEDYYAFCDDGGFHDESYAWIIKNR